VAVLRENVKVIRRTHLWTYALCGLAIIVALLSVAWFFLHQWYADQIEQERAALIEYTDKNRAVLIELAESHRTLDIIQDPKHPNRRLLFMKNASGWQLAGGYGVIEFSK
jgi:hypothetical protein